jgi:hypothetical protein
MSNFKFWMNEIADMPEQRADGSWYDLETGLPFDNSVHYKTGGKTTRWKPSEDLKSNRKIAKFYGGKALTGTAKQKEWAEKLRADVLRSDKLSDEQKAEFIATDSFLNTTKFWINNKGLSADYFTKENLVREYNALSELADKHYDVLVRSGSTGPKDRARAEIIKQLTENKFQLEVHFPNFDPYDCFGVFKK